MDPEIKEITERRVDRGFKIARAAFFAGASLLGVSVAVATYALENGRQNQTYAAYDQVVQCEADKISQLREIPPACDHLPDFNEYIQALDYNKTVTEGALVIGVTGLGLIGAGAVLDIRTRQMQRQANQ